MNIEPQPSSGGIQNTNRLELQENDPETEQGYEQWLQAEFEGFQQFTETELENVRRMAQEADEYWAT